MKVGRVGSLSASYPLVKATKNEGPKKKQIIRENTAKKEEMEKSVNPSVGKNIDIYL